MKKLVLILLVILTIAAAVVLVACSQVITSSEGTAPAVTEEFTLAAEQEQQASTGSGCRVPGEGQLLMTDAAHGYCLHYPETYQVWQSAEHSVNILLDSPMNHVDPRVSISVEEASNRSLESVVEMATADLQGFDVAQSTVNIGGVEAAVLDNIPGQDMNRQVFVVKDDTLFHMHFSPADNPEMEAFFSTIVSSFTWIPVETGAPLQDGKECPEAIDGTALLFNKENGYCLLYPDMYQLEQPGDAEDVLFVGSLMDVEHPKLFINVSDSEGKTLDEISTALVAELEGFGVVPTFGLLVDAEPAVILDGVPGQDLGRQVLMVHEGRLYKMTFVPFDQSQSGVFAELEKLYATVIDSFHFFP